MPTPHDAAAAASLRRVGLVPLVRVCLVNVEAAEEAAADDGSLLRLAMRLAPVLREASPDLADAVDRVLAGTATPRAQRKALRALMRYIDRAAYRPTPFGELAGVSWGSPVPTDDGIHRVPADRWTLDLDFERAEAGTLVRSPHLQRIGNWWWPATGAAPVRATPLVDAALSDEPRGEGLSVADDRKSLSAGLGLAHRATRAQLRARGALVPIVERATAGIAVTTATLATRPGLPVPPGLDALAERGAGLLEATCGTAPLPEAVRRWVWALLDHVGEDVELPLLDLLKPGHPVGVPAREGPGRPGARNEARDAVLERLYRRAVVDEHSWVNLTERDLEDLARSVSRDTRPQLPWLDVLLVHGTLPEVGRPVTLVEGTAPSGAYQGRFTRLLDTHAGISPNGRSRDLGGAAGHVRVVALSVRDGSPRGELLGCSRLPEDHLIVAPDVVRGTLRLADVRVAVSGGHIRLRDAETGRLLHLLPADALDPTRGPAAGRLLAALARAQASVPAAWSWGEWSRASRLPGVRAGEIALALPRWRLPAQVRESGPEACASWLRAQDAPDQLRGAVDGRWSTVRASAGHPVLRDERCVLEPWPALQPWLQGPEGLHTVEVVQPVLREVSPWPQPLPMGPPREGRATCGPVREERASAVLRPARGRVGTPRSVGSISPPRDPDDWVVLTLRVPAAAIDQVVVDQLTAVGGLALSGDAWFLRLTESEPLLRWRLAGAGRAGEAFEHGRSLVEDGGVLEFDIRPHRPEVAKAGGVSACSAIQAFACADSIFVARALDLRAGSRDGAAAFGMACLLGVTGVPRPAWLPTPLADAWTEQSELAMARIRTDVGPTGLARVRKHLAHHHANRWGLSRPHERALLGMLASGS